MKRALFFIILISSLFPLIAGGKSVVIEAVGMVIAPPGEFGKQFFYIIDGKNTWQIYSYQKKFPQLKKGDIVRVRGEQSETHGLSRLKIKEARQIKILDNHRVPDPISISLTKIKENFGKLVLLDGEVRVDADKKFYSEAGGKKINLVSPKLSGTLNLPLGNYLLKGIPLQINKLPALLIVSSTPNTISQNKKIIDAPSSDLVQPQTQLIVAKSCLIVLIIFLLLAIIRKIIKKDK
ncbi:MAG: hypothetical protein NT165_02505 [Candidatus Falkowbacteria bacterium]|nr:hypothetical protein [Candidatus Falkowbacteria bacterium]